MTYYTYLISSLPMLHFFIPLPFSFEKFIQRCHLHIPTEGLNILKKAAISGKYDYQIKQPTLRRWMDFDTALRNELVKLRADRKHIEPSKYLRGDKYAQTYITHIALSALREPSVLEAEMGLDQHRWNMLNELEAGHYFDLDFLIVYGLRLLILERWERVRRADKARILEETLSKQQ